MRILDNPNLTARERQAIERFLAVPQAVFVRQYNGLARRSPTKRANEASIAIAYRVPISVVTLRARQIRTDYARHNYMTIDWIRFRETNKHRRKLLYREIGAILREIDDTLLPSTAAPERIPLNKENTNNILDNLFDDM